MSNEKVYIEIKKKVVINVGEKVIVKDVANVFSTRKDIIKKVEEVKIGKGSPDENWDYFGSVDITKKILEKYSDLDLDILGSSEIIIEYKSREEKRPFWEIIKVISVCIILFFGATIAIMNFHEDVGTRAALGRIYFIFTGIKDENPLIMGIPYSIGIGAGMATFFSRIWTSSKRRKKEPGPMEVELFVYDDEIEQYVTNELKKNKEL